MSRITNTLGLDFTLQRRYGLFYAAAFVTAVWIILFQFVPDSWLPLGVPFIIFMDLGIIGFYFLAGQVIIEKSERTLNAMVVTPLQFREYMASKIITLTVMAWVVSLLVTLATVGFAFNFIYLTIGTIFTSTLMLGIGMVAVVPYSSISSFLLPSQLYFLPIIIPVIDFLNWIKTPIVYIIPSQASLLLLKAAFSSITTVQLIYAIIYQTIWIIILFRLAERRFNYHVISGSTAGERRVQA